MLQFISVNVSKVPNWIDRKNSALNTNVNCKLNNNLFEREKNNFIVWMGKKSEKKMPVKADLTAIYIVSLKQIQNKRNIFQFQI